MGRHRKYRNNAEKQAAYRLRKMVKNMPDDLRDKVALLRKRAYTIETESRLSPVIEVYKRFDGTITYKLLKTITHYATLDRETFEAIESELVQTAKTWDTKRYKFKPSFFAGM